MVGDFPLTWMAEAFRRSGLRVKEVKGWRTAGRPYSFAPRGVVFHHTASSRKAGPAPALGICVKGRSDLPGPLCNVMVGRDGTVFVIAAGRANHAGFGGPWRNIPKDSGNQYTAGVEVENDGVGEPWSEELLDCCAVVFATLLLGLRRKPEWLCGHKEWAPTRKIDPKPVDMRAYRRRVQKAILELARKENRKRKPKPAPGSAARPKAAPEIYVVQPGDTLWSIATKHGLSVSELKGLNELKTDLIHPGDQLTVDGDLG